MVSESHAFFHKIAFDKEIRIVNKKKKNGSRKYCSRIKKYHALNRLLQIFIYFFLVYFQLSSLSNIIKFMTEIFFLQDLLKYSHLNEINNIWSPVVYQVVCWLVLCDAVVKTLDYVELKERWQNISVYAFFSAAFFGKNSACKIKLPWISRMESTSNNRDEMNLNFWSFWVHL